MRIVIQVVVDLTGSEQELAQATGKIRENIKKVPGLQKVVQLFNPGLKKVQELIYFKTYDEAHNFFADGLVSAYMPLEKIIPDAPPVLAMLVVAD
ncbi:hypothetical protein ACQZV8_10385 [Magnetococcales bacterium HHB-1]